MREPWSPQSWRTRPASQMPAYPDAPALAEAERQLAAHPPLIFAGEAAALRARLAQVAEGRAFLLQGGDCAESFDELGADTVRGTFRVMLQMAVVLTFAAACPVVKVGRIAGQFAKPRSSASETVDGVTLPSDRGDIVNASGFARMGAQQVGERLAPLVRTVARAGRCVVWCCDPMHGNTAATAAGVKTRDFQSILAEVRGFFAVHAVEGTHPGGVHFELTSSPPSMTGIPKSGVPCPEPALTQRLTSRWLPVLPPASRNHESTRSQRGKRGIQVLRQVRNRKFPTQLIFKPESRTCQEKAKCKFKCPSALRSLSTSPA